MAQVIAVDVGGTGIKAALLDRDGAVREEFRRGTGRECGAGLARGPGVPSTRGPASHGSENSTDPRTYLGEGRRAMADAVAQLLVTVVGVH
ncbi:hypothetical protein ACFZB9_34525 [Kitasatospora sp. NPDC008050]|uniref:hypothetical protein n=1 Tax=Kitasatospora sp. NPDC008050 TaxID=3364021 RepID=UPI0036EBF4AF